MKTIILSSILLINLLSFAQELNISNQARLGTASMSYPSTIKLSDGGYMYSTTTLSGISEDKNSANYGVSDIWIVKLDDNFNIVWQKSFGGSDQDENRSYLCETPEGDVLIAGFSRSPVSGNKTVGTNGMLDYWIIKLNASGGIIWQRNFGGTDLDAANSIAIVSPNQYVIGGVSLSNISGDKSEVNVGDGDNWVIMIDSSGNLIWDRTIGGTEGDEITQLIYNPFDETIVAVSESRSGISGDKTETNYGQNDLWFFKLDLQGNLLGQKTIGGSLDETVRNMLLGNDGDLYVSANSRSGISGNKTSETNGNYDYWVLKLDNDLNVLMDKSYGGDASDFSPFILKTEDHQLLMIGGSNSAATGDKTEESRGLCDFWIVSIDTNGTINWEKTIGGSECEYSAMILEDSDNVYSVFGFSESTISGEKTVPRIGINDIWMFKLSTTLDINPITDSFFTLYPNPTSTKLHISGLKENHEYSIFDLQGRIVQKGIIIEETINLQNLQSGVYSLHILSGDHVFVERFVVE